MLRLRLLCLAVPTIAVVLGAAACEDASNDTTAITVPDAGALDANANFDGALPDGGNASTDGGNDASTTGLSVLVANASGPKMGVRVIFHDATGGIVGEATTDATGGVTATTAPSMVTVLYQPKANGIVTPLTFMGVQAGDTLRVVPQVPDSKTALGTISTTFAANTISQSAAAFDVRFSPHCNGGGNTTQPLVVSIFPNCVRAKNTVFATASKGQTLGFGFAKNVAAPAGGNAVAVGPITFAAPGTRTLTASNLPGNVNVVAQGFAVVEADAFDLAGAGDIRQPAGLTFQTSTGFADAYQTSLDVSVVSNGNQLDQRLYRREAAAAGATGALTNIDFATALPVITSALLDTANIARPVLTLATTANTVAHTGYARIQWLGNTGSGIWTFVYPGDAKTFTVPALPTDATAFTPRDAVSLFSALYLDGTLLPTYSLAKKLPIAPDADLDLLTDSLALPADGTLKVTKLQPATL